jgi:hypothetical protein
MVNLRAGMRIKGCSNPSLRLIEKRRVIQLGRARIKTCALVRACYLVSGYRVMPRKIEVKTTAPFVKQIAA